MNEPSMTLSHCWGGAGVLKLTAGSLHELSTGIEISILLQTFQDAIPVALALRVNYLWIDSLCIFQDSIADWARKSSAMGNVYRHGLCNIAATASKDGNGGLFLHCPRTKQTLETPGHYTCIKSC
jgi:hypothetical protein